MSRAIEVLPAARAPERERADSVAPAAKGERWLGLDLFRFCAVVLMVQGHVFTTLLDQATKAEGWYPHHSFVHGYTAPMFLIGAGLAFGFTTFRRWDAHASGRGKAVRKRYARYLWLLVIGYGLHLPTLRIDRLLAIDDPARIERMLQVDVLHHIGISLAIAQLLVFLTRKRRTFVIVIGALAVFCVASAPWVWGLDVSALPVWMRGYVNASAGSYFPIVPWAGFTYAGIVIAHVLGLSGRASEVSRKAAWPFLTMALLFMIAPVVADRFGPFDWPSHNFWKTNPLFFFWRLGNVLLVLAVLCFAERGMRKLGWLDAKPNPAVRAVLPWVKLAAAETLVIYVLHLVLLHGSALGRGIKHSGVISQHAHGVFTAAAVTVALLAVCVIIAKGWHELKKHPRAFLMVQVGLAGVFYLYAIGLL